MKLTVLSVHATKWKLKMKVAFPGFLFLPLIILSMSTGCLSRDTIKEEFVRCLIQTNADTVSKVDSSVRIIDRNLYITEEKLLKLEQVSVPAFQWIDNQKVKLLEEHRYGSWHSRVTPESLAEFRNDQYQVTALELYAYGIGTSNQKFDTVIKVTDLSTKTESDLETAESDLKWRKSTLEVGRQEKLEEGHLAASTLLNVIDHLKDWEVSEINGTTHSISGPGLGMTGELSDGRWTYYRDSKEIVPGDARSLALQKILSGGL